MNMYLRKAKINESTEILKFYHRIIESIRDSDFKPKWNNEYPNLEFIEKSIKKEELYIYTKNNIIISSLILNDSFDVDYSYVNWSFNAKLDEITVMHAFAIDSKFRGKGLGRKIFDEIKDITMANNKKTIRIDVIDGNVGAQKVYEHLGFEYIGCAETNQYPIGPEKFHLYEYVLKK